MKEIYEKLGEVLELERKSRKLTLESISEQLKISETNLGHVEAGAVDETPSELYFGLFAKSYAEFLGIDYTATIEAIKDEIGFDQNGESKSTGSAKPDNDNEAENADSSDDELQEKDEGAANGKKIFGWLLGIIVFFACFMAVWMLLIDPASETTDNGLNSGEQTYSSEADNEAEAVKAKSILEGFEFGDVPKGAPEPIILKLVASEESWANILADGEQVISRNLVVWKEYVVEAKYRLQVSIAHPSRVETHLNGKKINLRDPATRRISRRLITQINLDEFMNPDTTSVEVTPQPRRVTTAATNRTRPAPVTSDTAPAQIDTTKVDTTQGN